MEINNLLGMDTHIVIGIVNERLRLECNSMAELASRYELSETELSDKMAQQGYHYDPLNNQFK
ncbi:DUF4250 domain-containing protein [Photobacterium toruni]|uniref:DUF4250 domain-containing protein n=1 Tax=Photobacterium toruni TaxID=1935446 RepID=A0A1T4UEB1_9GAMM|nr:DUF4250 domain-containing protein [Photobacterium toruni]MEC6816667.1 DUF4250 domain-containing protein [Photobacterium toruni]MEC6833556.1 DUF4250 domain-containing protein [Photobacterium toruni]SKA50801.1 hypothetical protein CZ814_03085 [Photobacterium toruni]